jgi:hypothetical protein
MSAVTHTERGCFDDKYVRIFEEFNDRNRIGQIDISGIAF